MIYLFGCISIQKKLRMCGGVELLFSSVPRLDSSLMAYELQLCSEHRKVIPHSAIVCADESHLHENTKRLRKTRHDETSSKRKRHHVCDSTKVRCAGEKHRPEAYLTPSDKKRWTATEENLNLLKFHYENKNVLLIKFDTV